MTVEYDAWRHLSLNDAVARMQFRAGVINETVLRQRLLSLGYTGARLEQEIEDCKANLLTRGAA